VSFPQNRHDWLANFFRPYFGPRKPRPRTVEAAAVRGVWLFDAPDGKALRIVAYTRGEARAQAKRLWGLKQLPVDLTITREVKPVRRVAA
jgi:hypothetical protein